MRWVALAIVIASASCPHRRQPPPPLCNMDRPEYLVPSCHLYVTWRSDYGKQRND